MASDGVSVKFSADVSEFLAALDQATKRTEALTGTLADSGRSGFDQAAGSAESYGIRVDTVLAEVKTAVDATTADLMALAAASEALATPALVPRRRGPNLAEMRAQAQAASSSAADEGAGPDFTPRRRGPSLRDMAPELADNNAAAGGAIAAAARTKQALAEVRDAAMAAGAAGVKSGQDLTAGLAGIAKAAEAPKASLAGIVSATAATSAGANAAARSFAAMNERAAGLNAAIAEGAGAVPALTVAAGAAEGGVERLSFATVGAKRELMVLGHEAISGNFARMPGSLMVLGERMGGLSLATMATGAAVVAVGYTFVQLVAAAEHSQEALNGVQAAFASTGQASRYNEAATKAMIDQLALLPGVSRDGAAQIVAAFARTRQVSGQLFSELIVNIDKSSRMMGKDAPAAAEELARAFAAPAEGARKLDAAYNVLDAAQLRTIELLDASGKREEAQALLLSAWKARVDELPQSLTQLQISANDLAVAWDRLTHSWSAFQGVAAGVAFALDQIAKAINLIGGEQSALNRITDLNAQLDLLRQTRERLTSVGHKSEGDPALVAIDQKIADLRAEQKKLAELDRAPPAKPQFGAGTGQDRATVKEALGATTGHAGDQQRLAELTAEQLRLNGALDAQARIIAALDPAKDAAGYRDQVAVLDELRARLERVGADRTRLLGQDAVSAADHQRHLTEIAIDGEREQLQHRAQMGEIARSQELKDEVALTEKKYAAESKDLQVKRAQPDLSTAEAAAIDRQLVELEARKSVEIQRLRDQSAVAAKQEADKASSEADKGRDEQYRKEIAQLDIKLAAAKNSAAERAQIMAEELATAERYYTKDSDQYREMQKKKTAADLAEVAARNALSEHGIQQGPGGAQDQLTDNAIQQANIAAARQLDELSAQEEIARLKDLKDQEYQIKLDALKQELALDGLTEKAKLDLNDKILNLNRQQLQTTNQLLNQEAAARSAAVHEWVAPVQSALSGMTQGILQGTLTWRKAEQQAATAVASSYVNMLAQRAMNYLHTHVIMAAYDALFGARAVAATAATEAGKTVATKTGAAARTIVGTTENAGFFARVGAQLASWLGLETAKTTATVAAETTKTVAVTAGSAERVTVQTAAAGAGLAAQGAADSGSIMMSAWTAMAGAYAAISAIPYVGPFLAPVVAAGAFAAVAAMAKSVFSAEGGWGEVPQDGAQTILHKKEMVLPAKFAIPLREMLTSPTLPRYGLPPDLMRLPDQARSQAQAAGTLPLPVRTTPTAASDPRPSRPGRGGGDTVSVAIHAVDTAGIANWVQKPGVGSALVKSINKSAGRGARLLER